MLESTKRASLTEHKFQIGQTVYFTSRPVGQMAADSTYRIVKLLPSDGDDYQYRIKSATEAFERVGHGGLSTGYAIRPQARGLIDQDYGSSLSASPTQGCGQARGIPGSEAPGPHPTHGGRNRANLKTTAGKMEEY